MAYVNGSEAQQFLEGVRDRLAISDKTEAQALTASVSYPNCVYYTSDTHNLVKDGKVISAGIGYGEVASTSTSTAFTATVPGITELKDGIAVLLRNNTVTSASGFTININGLGAKPAYNSMETSGTPTRDTTIFNIKYTMLFIYSSTIVSGGGWICYRGYNSNTTYSAMSQTEANTGTATTARTITAKVLHDTISNRIASKQDVLNYYSESSSNYDESAAIEVSSDSKDVNATLKSETTGLNTVSSTYIEANGDMSQILLDAYGTTGAGIGMSTYINDTEVSNLSMGTDINFNTSGGKVKYNNNEVGLAPLVIEVNDTDELVPSGTYASITAAIAAGRNVVVKVIFEEDDEALYLPLLLDTSQNNSEYYFCGLNYSSTYQFYIDLGESCGFGSGLLSPTYHTHGNIQSTGALQTTDITIANGDKLVVTDASNSNKIARTSLAFDGSTATQALTKKGTFETFVATKVTITENSGTYSSDKTYDEIKALVDAERTVYAFYNELIFTLDGYSTDESMSDYNKYFSFCSIYYEDSDDVGVTSELYIWKAAKTSGGNQHPLVEIKEGEYASTNLLTAKQDNITWANAQGTAIITSGAGVTIKPGLNVSFEKEQTSGNFLKINAVDTTYDTADTSNLGLVKVPTVINSTEGYSSYIAIQANGSGSAAALDGKLFIKNATASTGGVLTDALATKLNNATSVIFRIHT